MAAKTTKVCLEHLNVPYTKWTLLEQCLIADSPKERRQEKKKSSNKKKKEKGKLKCRNSAGFVMLWVLNKKRNKLKQLKGCKTI